jgi:hypothetical protein
MNNWIRLGLLFVVLASCNHSSEKNKDISFDCLNLKEWKIIQITHGDIGCDGTEDVAMVWQHTIAHTEELEPDFKIFARLLMVTTINDSMHTATSTIINNTIVEAHEQSNMLDPFQDIKIENGELLIHHNYFHLAGSWWTSDIITHYELENNQLKLRVKEETAFHRGGGERIYEYQNFTTGEKYKIKDNYFDEMEKSGME